MSDDDKTPVNKKTPFEMVLEKLDEVGADAKLAVTESREAKDYARKTNDLQLQLNQRFNTLELRVAAVERSRIWLPILALIAALVALYRSR